MTVEYEVNGFILAAVWQALTWGGGVVGHARYS
jgi:hypothetical protein